MKLNTSNQLLSFALFVVSSEVAIFANSMCVVRAVCVLALVCELIATSLMVAVFAHTLRVESQIRMGTFGYRL
jgi:hypothetical protein